MKQILTLLFLTLFCSLNAIEGQVLTTLAKNIEDQWVELLPLRAPMISMVSKVVRGQPFQIRILFRNPVLAEQKADVAGSLKITGPDGKVLHETKEDVTLFRATCQDSRNLQLSPYHAVMSFEEKDPSGLYRIDLLLKDRNSGEYVPLRTAIQLEDRLPLPDKPVPWQRMLNQYYASPHPEQILSAFREMLKLLEEKQRQGKSNPIPLTAPFYFLLQDNPQLQNEFFRLTETLPRNQKLHAAGIINSLGPEAVKAAISSAGPETRALLNRRAVNLFEVKEVSRPIHLDVLWSEFFIRGTAEPLKKIVGALDLLRSNMPPEQFRKLPNPTQKDRENLVRTLIGRAALWSLSSNAKQHRLVQFYLEGFFLQKRTGSDFSRALVGLILKKQMEDEEKKTPSEGTRPSEKSRTEKS